MTEPNSANEPSDAWMALLGLIFGIGITSIVIVTGVIVYKILWRFV